MKKGFGSRGGNVVRITQGGHAVYGSPANHVPVESQRAKIAKGAAIVVGSLAGAALIGVGAGKIARVAANYENKAKDLTKLAEKGVNVARKAKVKKFAAHSEIVHKFLENAHTDARFIAFGGGAAGASYGANKILDATGKKNATNEAIVVAGAGAGSLFSVRLAEYAQLAPTFADAAKVAAQKIGKKITRRG